MTKPERKALEAFGLIYYISNFNAPRRYPLSCGWSVSHLSEITGINKEKLNIYFNIWNELDLCRVIWRNKDFVIIYLAALKY